jgi:hypothetical protein
MTSSDEMASQLVAYNNVSTSPSVSSPQKSVTWMLPAAACATVLGLTMKASERQATTGSGEGFAIVGMFSALALWANHHRSLQVQATQAHSLSLAKDQAIVELQNSCVLLEDRLLLVVSLLEEADTENEKMLALGHNS